MKSYLTEVGVAVLSIAIVLSTFFAIAWITQAMCDPEPLWGNNHFTPPLWCVRDR